MRISAEKEPRWHSRLAVAGGVLASALLALACLGAGTAGVSHAFASEDESEPYDASLTSTPEGDAAIQEIYDGLAQQAEDYAPKVTTLEDGTRIQRTPVDPSGYFQMGYASNTNYNTYYLNADNRGCNACHADLASVVENMDFYHIEVRNGYGTDVQVTDCILCHDIGYGYVEKLDEFGSLIHGIHSKESFTGDCMSCHTATSDGMGMRLWDEAKYDVMQGFTYLSEFDADFSYEQDNTTDMFEVSWFWGQTNVDNIGSMIAGKEPDESIYDSWEITVDGLVDNPYTMTLSELIAEAPSETRIITEQCVMNMAGGEQIANVEITGIPISWLLEKAGVQDGATIVNSVAPDGWSRGMPLDMLDQYDGYLVYKMNGEPVPYGDGFPCMTMYVNMSAAECIRWVCELEVVDSPVEEMKYWDGWTVNNADGSGINEHNGGHAFSSAAQDELDDITYVNKPNVAIFHFHEGQIIEAGQPYTWEGYAYAFDEQVVSVEFSLDRGETWYSFDTSDSDSTKWVYWHFTYTPEEPGSYVLSVRATTDTGKVSYQPDVVMFNAE